MVKNQNISTIVNIFFLVELTRSRIVGWSRCSKYSDCRRSKNWVCWWSSRPRCHQPHHLCHPPSHFAPRCVRSRYLYMHCVSSFLSWKGTASCHQKRDNKSTMNDILISWHPPLSLSICQRLVYPEKYLVVPFHVKVFTVSSLLKANIDTVSEVVMSRWQT